MSKAVETPFKIGLAVLKISCTHVQILKFYVYKQKFKYLSEDTSPACNESKSRYSIHTKRVWGIGFVISIEDICIHGCLEISNKVLVQFRMAELNRLQIIFLIIICNDKYIFMSTNWVHLSKRTFDSRTTHSVWQNYACDHRRQVLKNSISVLIS